MQIKPHLRTGYQLLHDGIIELSRIEGNGIRIDVPKLAEAKKFISGEMREMRAQLEKDKIWRMWHQRFGARASLTSHQQLAIVLGLAGHQSEKLTAKGEVATDDEALAQFEHIPFISILRPYYRYEKAYGTFLNGIEEETVDGFLHPVFNLHLVVTYRSSSDSPNFQNMPVRDKNIAKIIRSLIIPRPKSCLVENDFKGIEVGVSACYHKDPMFIKDITTPGRDMHRDMAAEVYCVSPSDVSKDARYGAKNKFVFPQFYGQKWPNCAPNLWEWIEKGKLKVESTGQPILEHLRAKGIRELGEGDFDESPAKGTFMHHVKCVEENFWGKRFKAYDQWKRNWYNEYLSKGHFDFYTGFRGQGFFSRNQVNNAPIQGSAFHCLLWTLIQVNRDLRRYKMKSKVLGQIHDSLIGDVRIDELSQYLEIVQETATVKLRKHYPWLIIPLEIEFEITPSSAAGGTWHDKKPTLFDHGIFIHPDNPKKRTDNAQHFMNALDHLHLNQKEKG